MAVCYFPCSIKIQHIQPAHLLMLIKSKVEPFCQNAAQINLLIPPYIGGEQMSSEQNLLILDEQGNEQVSKLPPRIGERKRWEKDY